MRVAALRVRACVYASLRPKGCVYNRRCLYMISPRSPKETKKCRRHNILCTDWRNVQSLHCYSTGTFLFTVSSYYYHFSPPQQAIIERIRTPEMSLVIASCGLALRPEQELVANRLCHPTLETLCPDRRQKVYIYPLQLQFREARHILHFLPLPSLIPTYQVAIS